MPDEILSRAGRMPGNRRAALIWFLALAGVLSGAAKTLPAATRASDFSAPQGSAPGGPTVNASQDVDVEGDLTVLVEDRRDGSRHHYILETAEGRYELESLPAGRWQTGMRVRVQGKQTGDRIALEPGIGMVPAAETGPSIQATSAVAAVVGAQKTAVILVNFQNNPVQPYTVATANNIVFTGTNNFDLENSYGQMWLTGDVFGWYTIPLNLSTTTCDFGTTLQTLATQAKAAATTAGVNLTGYTRFVFGFPDTAACGFWGIATIGGSPSQAFINGDIQVQVVSHEMGHNLGLDHSHSLDCGTAIIGTACTMNEYGDTMDTMGSSTYHFNAFQKERLGWLGAGVSPPITTVTATGTYTIDGYETNNHNPKALKISKGGTPTSYYYVELRRAFGVDAGLVSNANVLNGLIIHQASPSDSDSSDLLDMTPATASWTDPALDVGQSFNDPTARVTITPVSIGASSATVTVTLGTAPTCTHVNPTVTLSPAQSAGVAAGTPVSFTVSVTNNDTAVCSASIFDLTDTVPAGWTGSLSVASVTLASGASGSSTFQVTSSTSAANGTYGITATGKNRGATSFAATASASYVVSNPCTPANPLVSLTPASSAGVAAGTPVSYTLTVTNQDSSFCTNATFDLTKTVPTGWTATVSPASLTLVPGGVSAATIQVTSPTSAVGGSYPVTGTAKNRAATTFTATTSATYVVATPCTQANPLVSLTPASSAAVAAGTPVSYTLTVTNNDSSSCSAATFDLTNVVPAGWTASYSTAALTLVPGGVSASTLQVTSPTSAAGGSYSVTATAKNRAATAYTATTSATYVVSNPCTPANPLVSMTPASSAGVAAGTPVSYTLTVTNRDGSSCSAATFDLTSAVPAGWSASSSPAALTLVPGGVGASTLQVTSAGTAVNGSYSVSGTAKNRAATAFTATASATYVVSNPTCAPATPLVSLSPASSAGVAAGTPVSYTVTVTNNDSSVCSAATFDLTSAVPAGWTASYSSTALTLVPGGAGASTLLVTSAGTAVNGSYTVSGTAKNRAAPTFTATGTATYLVSNPVGGATSFADNFDRADSASLGASWTPVAGSLVVGGNIAKNGAGVIGSSLAVATALTGATQMAEADFTSVDNNLGPRFGVVLRYQDATNYYLIHRRTGGSSLLVISKVVNGVETVLGTSSLANPTKGVAFHIKGRVTGTTVSLDFNGVNKINVTDATFTTGKVGLALVNSSATAQQEADNFNATAQ